jgi:hypothetical protein
MGGLLRLIFIILCIYLAFKWVIGPLIRMLLQSYLKKVVEKQGGQFRDQHQKQKKPDGSIHVDYVPKSPKKANKGDSEGEYIDYEEVK